MPPETPRDFGKRTRRLTHIEIPAGEDGYLSF